MVDRTVYANEAATPKLNLRQIFGRQGLDTALCRLSADKGLLTVEMFAMLGQDLSSAKETLRKLWEADMSPLGADAASQELAVMSLAAVWQAAQALQTQYASRRARMEEDPNKIPELSQEDHAEFRDRFVRVHPDVILIDAKEPHKKFVERLSRDFLIHGIVPFYEPAEIRTRADVIVVKSGLSRNAEDLLSISRADQPEPVTDVTTLLHRLHAFFMARVPEHLRLLAHRGAAQVPSGARTVQIRVPGTAVSDGGRSRHTKEDLPSPLRAEGDVHSFLTGPARGPEQPQIPLE